MNLISTSIRKIIQFQCLGNHEFDDGVDNLVQYLAHVKTTTVTANLNWTSDARLNETNVKNSTILVVDGVKIGIVGYLTPDTMVRSENILLYSLPVKVVCDQLFSKNSKCNRLM